MTTQSMAKLHRHKNRICEFNSHNNSFLGTEHRIKIILSIEHQYKNYFVTTTTKKTLKRNKLRNNFFTVTDIVLNDDQVYWSQNSNNKLNLILDIFFTWTDVTKLQTLHYNGIQIFKIITVIVPLQKFRQRTSQRNYYERSQ